MAFWSQATTEPLRQFRWTVIFGANEGAATLDSQIYALKKVDRPKATISEVTHKYLNHEFYYPGRLKWEPINMTIAAIREGDGDLSGGPGTSTALMTTLVSAGYMIPTSTQPEQRKTLAKQKFANGLGSSIFIQNLDPDGVVIEQWKILNPFFTSVQFGSLDYGSDEIVEVQCTLKYDAAYHTVGAGDAAPTGANPFV